MSTKLSLELTKLSREEVLRQVSIAVSKEKQNSQTANEKNSSTTVAFKHLQKKEPNPPQKNELNALQRQPVIDLSKEESVPPMSLPNFRNRSASEQSSRNPFTSGLDTTNVQSKNILTYSFNSIPGQKSPSVVAIPQPASNCIPTTHSHSIPSQSKITSEPSPSIVHWHPLRTDNIKATPSFLVPQTPVKRSLSSSEEVAKRQKAEAHDFPVHLQNIKIYLDGNRISVQNGLNYIEGMLNAKYSSSPKVNEYLYELKILKAECLQKLGRNKESMAYINSDLIIDSLFEKNAIKIYLIKARVLNKVENADFTGFYEAVAKHPKWVDNSVLSIEFDIEKATTLNSLGKADLALKFLHSIQAKCYQTVNPKIIGLYEGELCRTFIKLNKYEEARAAALKGEAYTLQEKNSLARLKGMHSILELSANNLSDAKGLIDEAVNIQCPNEKLHVQLLDKQAKIDKLIAKSNASKEKNEAIASFVDPVSDAKSNSDQLVASNVNDPMDISSAITQTTTSSANFGKEMGSDVNAIAEALMNLGNDLQKK